MELTYLLLYYAIVLINLLVVQCLGEIISKHDLVKGSYRVLDVPNGQRTGFEVRVSKYVSKLIISLPLNLSIEHPFVK